VLLKNANQILPLSPALRKLAVIGLLRRSGSAPWQLPRIFVETRDTAGRDRDPVRRESRGPFRAGSTYTAQSEALVPPTVLTLPAGAGRGVLAEYFDNGDLQGQPKLRRVEARPYLQGAVIDTVVAAAVPRQGYSVRWSGMLRAPVTGIMCLLRAAAALDARRCGSLSTTKNCPKSASSDLSGRSVARSPQMSVSLEAGRSYRLRRNIGRSGLGRARNCCGVPPTEPLLAEAVDAVRNSDVTVAFVGLNPSLEGEEMPVNVPGFLGGDRTDLKLPEAQERLLQAAIATGKPVVVVLTSGSAVAVNYAAERAAAVLTAWYGGEEAGTAIAETLAGANNPAGRLPVTFYKERRSVTSVRRLFDEGPYLPLFPG